MFICKKHTVLHLLFTLPNLVTIVDYINELHLLHVFTAGFLNDRLVERNIRV